MYLSSGAQLTTLQWNKPNVTVLLLSSYTQTILFCTFNQYTNEVHTTLSTVLMNNKCGLSLQVLISESRGWVFPLLASDKIGKIHKQINKYTYEI